MKFIHLSDLHLGKRLNAYSLIEDQEYILREICGITEREKPDFAVIAGDIYDKASPSAEAVKLFDGFLTELSGITEHIFVISGNHDSAERIAFGSKIMSRSGIHLSPVYNGKAEPVVLSDEYGCFSVYMLPFVKPSAVRRFFEDAEADTYTDAVRTAVQAMNADFSKRNVIIAHQFVTGAVKCDSEEISVGGIDSVDRTVFDGFDYVALGHIHGPQNVGGERIRYCGTPLKYSFSEVKQSKSVSVCEIGEKGTLSVRKVPLKPLRDMRIIRGEFDTVCSKEFSENGNNEDYLHVILTDGDEVPEALGRLRTVYPNIMSLEYDNSRTSASHIQFAAVETESKLPIELFDDFYTQSNGHGMNGEQYELVKSLIEKIWEGQE